VHALVVSMRPQQWVKNLACFAGLIFSMQLFRTAALGRSLVGFVAFCLASSAVYLFNDFIDRKRDQLNPRTARRPLACGALSPALAVFAMAVLAALAALVAAPLGLACLATIAVYGALNVAYSVRLKHSVIADVICIALGFVLRVVCGVYVVNVRPTAWVVLCMFFLALFMGFAKRRSELANKSASSRRVLQKYSPAFLDTLLAVSAALTILCYALFTVQRNPTLVITVVPVVYCVSRYLQQVMVHGRGESPDVLLLSDRKIWFAVGIWLVLCVGILYTDVRLIATSNEVPHRTHARSARHKQISAVDSNR
jgi:4-hydroxybenzoate polyprenyltransferase